jgi:hypothetical protein
MRSYTALLDEIPMVFEAWVSAGRVRRDDGSLNISMFLNGACPVFSISYSRLIEATADLPVSPELIGTSRLEELEKRQQTDALFIGGKEMRLGPPPSKRKIRRAVMRGL